MTVHLPTIGDVYYARAISLLQEYPQNIVGSFWVMCGYGFEYQPIPEWWLNNALSETQAQGIINAFETYGSVEENVCLGFCIIVFADSSNPAHLSYLIQHLRMLKFEGIALLKIMARHNIPTYTLVTYPEEFLNYRYGSKNPTYQYLRETLNHWSVQVWEDYCSYLMSVDGQRIFYKHC